MAAIEVFRTDWEQAKDILAKEKYSGIIPKGHEPILEDWYKIRDLYLRDGNTEQFAGQRDAFDQEYDKELDASDDLVAALAMISKMMSPASP